MGKPFFTKKQKALMRERRRKKKKSISSSKKSDDNSKDSPSLEIETTTTKTLAEKRPLQEVVDSESNSTKRARYSQKEEDEEEEQHMSPNGKKDNKVVLDLSTRRIDNGRTIQVIVPSNLSTRDAKKFRKDARRQLRQQTVGNGNGDGTGTVNIEFVSASEISTSSQANNNKKKKSKTKQFPSIQELLQNKQQLEELETVRRKREEKLDQVPDTVKEQYVALDCEMVGIGTDGKKSALARVSIVDWNKEVLLDTFVQVPTRVTDFRTKYSGVTPKNINQKNDAMDVTKCREVVATILKDKILVGHALVNDLKALLLTHPKKMIRDTAKYRPYQRYANSKWRPRKLRDLARENLPNKESFQEGEHDSVLDAQTTMELFQLVYTQWEKELAAKNK